MLPVPSNKSVEPPSRSKQRSRRVDEDMDEQELPTLQRPPTSTNVSSPVRATKKRSSKKVLPTLIADYEEPSSDGPHGPLHANGYERDNFVVSDNVEPEEGEDAFEPVRPSRRGPSSRATRPQHRQTTLYDTLSHTQQSQTLSQHLATLGPPIDARTMQNPRYAQLDEVHQDIVDAFVEEVKVFEEEFRNRNHMRKPIFTETQYREMAIRWTRTLDAMRAIPDINQDKVDRYGAKFIPLVERFWGNYREMMVGERYDNPAVAGDEDEDESPRRTGNGKGGNKKGGGGGNEVVDLISSDEDEPPARVPSRNAGRGKAQSTRGGQIQDKGRAVNRRGEPIAEEEEEEDYGLSDPDIDAIDPDAITASDNSDEDDDDDDDDLESSRYFSGSTGPPVSKSVQDARLREQLSMYASGGSSSKGIYGSGRASGGSSSRASGSGWRGGGAGGKKYYRKKRAGSSAAGGGGAGGGGVTKRKASGSGAKTARKRGASTAPKTTTRGGGAGSRGGGAGGTGGAGGGKRGGGGGMGGMGGISVMPH